MPFNATNIMPKVSKALRFYGFEGFCFRPTQLVFLVSIHILASCDANLTISGAYPSCEENCPSISKIEPIAALSGEEITITGSNFMLGMQVGMADELLSVDLVSDSEAKLVVPDGPPGEMKAIAVLNDKSTSSEASFYRLSGDYPLITADPALICEGMKFYNPKGKLSEGTKNCSGDSYNIDPDKIVAGYKIGDVKGTVILPDPGVVAAGSQYGAKGAEYEGIAVSGSYAECTADGETGCVATSSYKAASSSVLLAGNIKSGVTIGGQLGDYPSSSYPLDGASATSDLDNATFSAKIKSDTAFEYWSSDGTRHTGQDDSDISASNIASGVSIFGTEGSLAAAQCTDSTQGDCESDSACRWTGSACEINPWHIRSGVTISGQTGSIKANCRNRANSSVYNSDTMPPGTSGTTAGTSTDWWDTIDNYNNNLDLLPTEQPSGWTSDHMCGKELWSDVTADGACDAAGDDCMMKDNVTGLIWSEGYPVSGVASANSSKTWSSAVSHCDSLNYGAAQIGAFLLRLSL